MPIAYSPKHSKLIPAKLPVKVLTSIGRLVRAFAEIDDLITLYICNLAEVSESRAIVMLGRTQGSTRVDIAYYLAKMTGEKITAIHKEIFNSSYTECRKCRNAVAHGVFLGKTEEGHFAFLTSDTAEPTGPSAIQIAISFSPRNIEGYAKIAEESIPMIIERLKLSSLRDTRLGRPLRPHRKALKQQSTRKKH